MRHDVVYQVYNLRFESNVPLPELAQAIGKEPEYAFRLLPAQEPRPASCHWFHLRRLPNGKLWLSCARQGSGYLLRFTDLADFLVSTDGRDIRCYPLPAIPLETIRHLFLDQVIPLVLSALGRLVLHASAVVASEGAIAFLGDAGQGKSTISGTFAKQGFPLLTDDCLLLEEDDGQLFGHPSYPGLRLRPDTIAALFGQEPARCQVAHYTEKKRLRLDNGRLPFCADPILLRRIYVLAPSEETNDPQVISLAPLPPRDTFMELVKHTYRLDITDRASLGDEFEGLGRVAASLPICRLAFPWDLSLLSAVRDAILEDLSQR
jgi:hypothetical protein